MIRRSSRWAWLMIDALLTGPQAPPTVLQPTAGTEPDLDLIKQVEQVTRLALEGPAPRFAGVPSVGITGAVEVLVFLISQLLHWLLFGCKNSQEKPRPVCEGASPAMLRPHAAVSRTGPHAAAEPLLCQIQCG